MKNESDNNTRLKRMTAHLLDRQKMNRSLIFWGIWILLAVYKTVQWMQYTTVPMNFICFYQIITQAFGDTFLWAFLYPVISRLTLKTLTFKNLWTRALIQLPMSIFFSLLQLSLYYVSTVLLYDNSIVLVATGKNYTGFIFTLFQYSFFFYCQIIAVIYLIEYRRLSRERKLETSQLQKKLAEAKLNSLKMQLHPHFLFNSLNSIHSLMDSDVKASKKMLTRLSDFLRFTLDDHEDQEVTLAREMAFIENYLKIEQTRFTDRLKVGIDIDPRTVKTRIPSFIFQPLVENAIKHGIAPFSKQGEITITSKIEDDMVAIEIKDNGPGIKENVRIRASSRKGIGLANVRERLKLFYGKKQKFELLNLPGGGFSAKISVPMS